MINETQLKKYCSEDISKIENYELAINDDTQTWCCHHRLEIEGQVRRTPRELSRCGLYWNRPANELILLTISEHTRLHKLGERNPMFGKHVSEETRKKISLSQSGENNSVFGTQWWNNGTINKRSKECPGEGWVRGRKPH